MHIWYDINQVHVIIILIIMKYLGRVYMTNHNSMKASSKYQAKKQPIRNKSSKFAQQEVDLTQMPLFFPEGYEKIFLTIYVLFLPYIAGVIFQFIYIAETHIELFLSLNEKASFIFTWLIGYEILATIILLYIIKLAISFTNENRKYNTKSFLRP